MAIFGEGMTGPDPLEAARASVRAKSQKRTQDNINRLGQGSSAFDKGVIAVGEVGGEWLGHGLANLFGIDQVDPEIKAAQQEAALVASINEIEGDPASAEYARQAGQKALEAGRQDLAFGFNQEYGNRAKAETALEAKAEATKKKVYLDGYKAQPSEIKLAVLASGNDEAWSAMDIPPGPEREALQEQAQTAFTSLQVKNKAAAKKVNESRSTAINNTDVTTTMDWMGTANIGATDGVLDSAEDVELKNKAIATLIATDAKLIMVEGEESGEPKSQSEANELASARLVESGRLTAAVSDGQGYFSKPEGYREITGFGSAVQAPKPAVAPPQSGSGKRTLDLTGN